MRMRILSYYTLCRFDIIQLHFLHDNKYFTFATLSTVKIRKLNLEVKIVFYRGLYDRIDPPLFRA